jgi:hypothetical protein
LIKSLHKNSRLAALPRTMDMPCTAFINATMHACVQTAAHCRCGLHFAGSH